jgi:hypothetical protein
MSRLRCINRVALSRENAYRRLEREQNTRREQHNSETPKGVPSGSIDRRNGRCSHLPSPSITGDDIGTRSVGE